MVDYIIQKCKEVITIKVGMRAIEGRGKELHTGTGHEEASGALDLGAN